MREGGGKKGGRNKCKTEAENGAKNWLELTSLFCSFLFSPMFFCMEEVIAKIIGFAGAFWFVMERGEGKSPHHP
jgi:hypothetical protein